MQGTHADLEVSKGYPEFKVSGQVQSTVCATGTANVQTAFIAMQREDTARVGVVPRMQVYASYCDA
jgi:hypothetical protein